MLAFVRISLPNFQTRGSSLNTSESSVSPTVSGSPNDDTSTVQVVVSMLVGLHLIFLFASVLSHSAGSELVSRLSAAAIPHSVVGLQTDFIPEFGLSQAMDFEDDHHFEVLVDGNVTHQFPSASSNETGIREGFRYQRFRQMARRAARAISVEDDVTLAELARGIGEYAIKQGDAKRVVVRLVAFAPYDWRDQAPRPLSESLDNIYYESLYSADVWRTRSGSIGIHKRVPAAEAAPPKLSKP